MFWASSKPIRRASAKGPFPTELKDALGETLRQRGMEFGATTGRPRRCGWFDAVAVRHAVRINGSRWLALTKLDVLEGVHPLKIAVAYRVGNKILREFPDRSPASGRSQPVYEEMPGFQGSIRGMTRYCAAAGQCPALRQAPGRARGRQNGDGLARPQPRRNHYSGLKFPWKP